MGGSTRRRRSTRAIPGAATLLKKVFDGTRLLDGTIDHDPLTLSDLAGFRAQQDAAAAQGLTLIPWVNATHHDQAELHAQAGETLVVDLEPYVEFWEDG